MDQIIIENLRIYANHGVYREENEKGQNFYINAILETNTRKAGTLDDLDLSTNYGEVCMFLNSFLKEHTYKLIETAAEKAAEAVLFRFPLVRRLTLEVRKPEAPVPLPFESVSVKIVRGWHKAYLSCGSNMGDRKMHLDGAVEAVRNDRKCRILRVSDWLATEPYGGVAKGEFLNGAIEMETLYTPEELLEKLHEIERIHGRERKVRWDSRTLDLDILLYEDCVMCTENLTIPHVDMQNRYFVLEPLRQIASYERHPVLGKSIGQMYEALMEREQPAESGQEEKPAEAGQTERPAESEQEEKEAEPGQKEQPAERKEQVDLEIQARKLTLAQPEPEPVQPEPQPEPEPVQAAPAPEAEAEPAPEEEPHFKEPLIPDNPGYINVMQVLVEEKAPKYIQMFGLCPCERCLADVKAFTLNHLPSKYVVIERGDLIPRLTVYEGKFTSDVTAQLLQACKVINERPHHGR